MVPRGWGAGILNLRSGPLPLRKPLTIVVGAPLRLPEYGGEASAGGVASDKQHRQAQGPEKVASLWSLDWRPGWASSRMPSPVLQCCTALAAPSLTMPLPLRPQAICAARRGLRWWMPAMRGTARRCSRCTMPTRTGGAACHNHLAIETLLIIFTNDCPGKLPGGQGALPLAE